MASANSQIELSSLDFNDIKSNFITFLQSQDTFKDYNFSGAGLSVLLDVLSYNTQYNAFYLNMVANEMFLDSAAQRQSVVSQAKLLNYVPKSTIAPTATINITVNQVIDQSLTLPAYTKLISQAIDGVNYSFVTVEEMTVNTTNNTAVFNNVSIKQGQPLSYSFAVDNASNPSTTFEIPDASIDTSSLVVLVQQSSSNTSYQVYKPATDYLKLNGDSLVYFVQEGLSGNYEIYFGDGILGKSLTNGNIVRVSYISTKGTESQGANSFSLMSTIGGYANTVVTPVVSASNGNSRETISSIKYQAPKSYSAQGRAVTKEDYVTILQQNKLGISFDAVNVWGGEENIPPVYGRTFICLKPTGNYNLTATQKQRLISEVINPLSVVTVTPTIVDPDYVYLKVNVNVLYDPKRTTLSSGQIQSLIKSRIITYVNTNLNTFDSIFSLPDLNVYIKGSNDSILSNEISLSVEKKIYPNLSSATTYNLYYGAPIERGMFTSNLSSSPTLKYIDTSTTSTTNFIDGVRLEEIPFATGGIESISTINPGFGYQKPPTVTIFGDGTGATAFATITVTGAIKEIVVVEKGSGYTSAIATITPAVGDTTGQLGAAVVNLQGRYGVLRSYYNNINKVKTILNQNIGTIDYQEGVITLNAFNPVGVNNEFGLFSIIVKPSTTIIQSSYNRLVTLDTVDPSSIVVNVTAKN